MRQRTLFDVGFKPPPRDPSRVPGASTHVCAQEGCRSRAHHGVRDPGWMTGKPWTFWCRQHLPERAS